MIFLHTADLHLDAPMEAATPQAKAMERRRELYLTLEKIADEGEKCGATAILIAGDLFDGTTPSPTAISRVAGIVLAHPHIDFILLCGNHDATAKVSLPAMENLKTFGESMVFRYGKVAIYGSEQPDALPESFGISKEDVNIVMLHGEVRQSTGEQISLSRWQNQGVDYLALGHYHSFEQDKLDGRGVYTYAGCPAGRGFDECGEKGFVKLSIEGSLVESTFVPLDGRQYHTVKVDVSALSSAFEVQNALEKATEGIPEQDAVKVELVGEVTPALLPDSKMLATRLSNRFWLAKVKDCTTLKMESKATDKSLYGVFARLVTEKIQDEDLRQRVLLCGLHAMRGEETAE